MSSLMGAIELLRGRELLPPNGVIKVRDLLAQFKPIPSNSIRDLLLKMFDSVSIKQPYAVVLCRFKGAPPDSTLEKPIEDFFRGAFTPGSGGLVEYWRDVSLGNIDISGSRVFGWVEVEISRDKAGGVPPAGPGRSGLVNYAINAVKRLEGDEVLNGFLGPIAVYAQNFSKDGAPPGATWRTPGWAPFWLDGSSTSVGPGAAVSAPPHGHDGNFLGHEMGHVFGMNHDVGPDLVTDYQDPCCIMSQNNPFLQLPWNRIFGPSLCLPHLMQRGWMYKRRVYYDNGGWQSLPTGISLLLAPITHPIAHANLGIKLAYSNGNSNWDYYLEYILPIQWNRNVTMAPFLVIRRMAPKYGETPAYLGSITIPSTVGTIAEWVEKSGNVRFQAQLTNIQDPVIQVNVKKL